MDMKATKRLLAVFSASMLVTTIIGVAGSAAAVTTRTTPEAGCQKTLNTSTWLTSWKCPIISDTAIWGNNIQQVYADLKVLPQGTSTTIRAQTWAGAYDFSHGAAGSAHTQTLNGNLFVGYDIPLPLWSKAGTWTVYDYYWVEVEQTGTTGNANLTFAGLGYNVP